jgi:hypothetical protein
MSLVRTIVLLSVILVTGAVGCRRKPRDEAPPAKPSPSAVPAQLVFKGSGGLQGTGSAEWGSCNASGTPEGLEVFCVSNYEHSLEVGKQRSGPTAPYQNGRLKIDVVSAFGNLPIKRRAAEKESGTVEFKGIDPATTAKIIFADGKSIAGTLVPFDHPMSIALREATKKPLQFSADEPTHPKGAPHSILYFVDVEDPFASVLGPAERLRDVDWVVVRASNELRDGGRTCSGYTVMGGGGAEQSFPLELTEVTLSLRERRTGAEISNKTFTAAKKCPEFASKGHAISGVDPKVEQDWMRAELKKRR